MVYEPDALRQSRSTGSSDLGLTVRVNNYDTDPTAFINVRLTNGATFYTATGGSGTAAEVQADQGAPALLANAWPVKVTDGSSVLGTAGAPLWVTGSVYVLDPGQGGAGTLVTVLSGSVAGLLVGGVPLSAGNPLPVSQQGTVTVTGSVGFTQAVTVANPVNSVAVNNFPAVQTVTGSVGFTQGVAVTNLPATQTITGSIVVGTVVAVTGTVGLSQAVAVSNFPAIQQVTGSVGFTQAVTVANPQATVTLLSGSVSGLLVGGAALSTANPVPVTGAVGFASGIAVTNFPASQLVTGSVGFTQGVTLASGSVTGLLVGGVPVSNANLLPVFQGSGSLTGLLVGGVAVSAGNPVPTVQESGSVTGLLQGGQPVSNANPLIGADYTVVGAAIQSGTFLSPGYAFLNSATSGSTAIVTNTVVGRKIVVMSANLNFNFAQGVTFPGTLAWFASTSSAGLVNVSSYFLLQSTGQGQVCLPFNPNGWFQTGYCQPNSTASLLMMCNSTASLGTTVQYMVTF